MDTVIKRINLWSGPRNISTALMYSFAQRSDCKVYDEPFYGYYLSQADVQSYHPLASLVIDNMECNGNAVIDLMLESNSKPILFFKQMAHHLLDLELSFLEKMINIILIRDPKDMLPSFAKEIANPKIHDVGYQAQQNLYLYFKQKGIPFYVLDAKRVQDNPRKVLGKLCDSIGMPFQEGMLTWQAGPIKEDGVWASHWYGNVHRSTCFQGYKEKKEEFPKELTALYDECFPIYEQLKKLAI